jgi:hypothetical protein
LDLGRWQIMGEYVRSFYFGARRWHKRERIRKERRMSAILIAEQLS